jgi:small-conductance mechanosensitive channel
MPSTRKRGFFIAGIFLVILLAITLLSNWMAPLLGGLGYHVHRVLNISLFDLGKQPLTALSLIKIVLFIAFLGAIARFSMGFLQKKLLVHTRLGKGQQYAIARVLSYVVFAIGLIVGLESLGLDLSSLLVLGGALGLGVGLGLQSIVSNFVAGLILLVEQPVRVGDRIQVGDTYGDVVAVKGRSTWVRTNDNVVIIVPNSDFIEKSVTNWTANDRRVRIGLPLGVSYDANPAEVREALLRLAAANPDVLRTPAPDVIFQTFGDSTLNFQLRVWTETMVQAPAILKSNLYFAIFEEFRKLSIELPFPQRDLHLRSISANAAAALSGKPKDDPGGSAKDIPAAL